MLLPSGYRVVLEVDGARHYASGTLANPSVCAATMRGDRELKLARYDVFRFGAADLKDEVPAREMLGTSSPRCCLDGRWRPWQHGNAWMEVVGADTAARPDPGLARR